MKKVFKLKAEMDFFDVEQDRKILRGEEFEVSEKRGKVILEHPQKLVSIVSITDVDEVLSDINVNDPDTLILTPTPEPSEEPKADQEATPAPELEANTEKADSSEPLTEAPTREPEKAAPVSKRRYTPRKTKK